MDVAWAHLLAAAHSGDAVPKAAGPDATEISVLIDLFSPLLVDLPEDRPLVVGHLAQSLDGFIAKADGESYWISGEDDLDHTHRLRAFCDGVLVGASTVSKDNCRLTVRRCEGDHPIRIVLDPEAVLSPDAAIFVDGEAQTIWVRREGANHPVLPSDVMVVGCRMDENGLDLGHLLSLLKAQGIERLFVEGGGVTVTSFIQAGLMDRLHLAVAPVFIGDGRRGITDALGSTLADCPRPEVRMVELGGDWLFDCDFRSA